MSNSDRYNQSFKAIYHYHKHVFNNTLSIDVRDGER